MLSQNRRMRVTELLPAPTSNGDSHSYWQAAADERLMLRKCDDCGEVHFMPRLLCPQCWSDKLSWFEATGRGSVHSFTVIRRASDPAFAHLCPYVVALIELEEGPRMMANILGEDALKTKIGKAVTVAFQQRQNDTKVPQFRLV